MNQATSIGLLVAGGVALIVGVDYMTQELPDTREFRDNNPFGVTATATQIQQNDLSAYPGITGIDNPLFEFGDLQSGINAGFTLMKQNYFDKGFNTVEAIANRWSGNAKDYAANLAAFMGYDVSDQLDYWQDGIALMNGISKAENGPGTQLAWTSLGIGLLVGGYQG